MLVGAALTHRLRAAPQTFLPKSWKANQTDLLPLQAVGTTVWIMRSGLTGQDPKKRRDKDYLSFKEVKKNLLVREAFLPHLAVHHVKFLYQLEKLKEEDAREAKEIFRPLG